MTENTENNEQNDEEIEIDLDHPWHQAALAVSPEPTPAHAQVVPVAIPGPEGKHMNAAMLTTVSINSVQTVFIPPRALMQLVEQAGEIFKYWDSQQQKKPSLIVANKEMEKAARAHADAVRENEQHIKGGH